MLTLGRWNASEEVALNNAIIVRSVGVPQGCAVDGAPALRAPCADRALASCRAATVLHVLATAARSDHSCDRSEKCLAVYTSEVCAEHSNGEDHLEKPERLTALLELARGEWQTSIPHWSLHEPSGADATDEDILRVHTRAHLASLKQAWALAAATGRSVSIDADTAVSPRSEAAARRAAGLVVAAVDAVFGSPAAVRRAFVMARPPGHHAEAERAMGLYAVG